METSTYVKKRTFELKRISEEEGLVLRTLLNLSEEGVKMSLNGDKGYWNDELSEDEAIKIGYDLCKKVMDMVDGE